MRTWPAIDVDLRRLTTSRPARDDERAASGRPAPFQGLGADDLLQAALTDFNVAAIDETAGDCWRVFFHSVDERERALAALRVEFADALSSIDVPDEDWAARSQASLRAIRIGSIVVAPPWDAEQVDDVRTKEVRLNPDTTYTGADPYVVSGFSRTDDPGFSRTDDPGFSRTDDPGFSRTDDAGLSRTDDAGVTRTIIITPSMGFGTGHHATTRLCLAALQRLELRGRTVLDVGTGSGVLAIAARMLGAAQVLGIDDDADAIESARENVARNAGVQIELQVMDLHRVVLTPFDLVVANLTGGLLMNTAARLQDLTAPAGRLVLSGFMFTEEIGVLAAFRGFAVLDRTQEEEWMCVTLQREGAFT